VFGTSLLRRLTVAFTYL